MNRAAALIFCSLLAAGCAPLTKVVAPSNVRNWEQDQARLATAEYVTANEILVHNVRNNRYFDEDTFVVRWEDRRYKLDELERVDFIMVPFNEMPAIAHTMLSFEFRPPGRPPEHLVASVEIRKELGETYAAWKGSARQYELMYVLADERDVIELRTNYRGEKVYLYETTTTPEASRRLLVDVLGRTNELAARPEFYDTLTNNCTTNLVRHINRINPNRIKYDYRVLLPGYSDELAYQEGLLVHHGTFAETKELAFLNTRAIAAGDRADFSQAIRLRSEEPPRRFADRDAAGDNDETVVK